MNHSNKEGIVSSYKADKRPVKAQRGTKIGGSVKAQGLAHSAVAKKPENVPKQAVSANFRQAVGALIGIVIGLAIFFAVERRVLPHYDFGTLLDASIPFLPWSLGVYLFFFPFVVICAAYASQDRFKEYMLAAGLGLLFGLVCFVLFPETLPRPDATLIENSFLRRRFDHMWSIDLASNGFPSLHVAITCLICRMMREARYRKVIVATGVLIILSTLTVKQHTLFDVAGGVAAASIVGTLAEKILRSSRLKRLATATVLPPRRSAA